MTIAEKLAKITENEQKVYDNGKAKAFSEVETVNAELEQILYGKDTGGKGFYDEFWDQLQNYGKRTDYRYIFNSSAFTHIDPKYFVMASQSDGIMCNISSLESVNWEKFDLSATSSLYNAFGFCGKLKYVDTDLGISGSIATALNSICRQCSSLERVQKLTAFPEAVWKNSFDACSELRDIIFEGVIGQNGLNLQWSTKLSKASITSVINALSSATSGLSVTLSKAAVQKAFETSEGANDGNNSDEWNTLIATKNNWTISLV